MTEFVQTLFAPAPWWLILGLIVMAGELVLLAVLFIADSIRVRRLMRQHGIPKRKL